MIVTSTYWKINNGNAYEGGRIGHFDDHAEGGITWASGAPVPADGIEIDEAEYNALVEANKASCHAASITVQTLLDQAQAALVANFASAKAKLMAGEPLTEAEAESLGGG